MIKRMQFLLPLAVIFFCGCEGIDFDAVQLHGSGKVASEKRAVSGFHAVTLAGTGDLRIEVGSQESLTIEADDNVLPHIRSDVEDGRLVIGTERGYSIRTSTPIRYVLVARQLDDVGLSGSGKVRVADLKADQMNVHLSGSGEIEFDQLNADHLSTRISGSGDIRIPGNVDSQEVKISGSGDFDGSDLQSNSAEVTVSGSGGSKLRVAKDLTAHVSGSGDVEYFGDPKVTKHVSGSGELIKRDGR